MRHEILNALTEAQTHLGNMADSLQETIELMEAEGITGPYDIPSNIRLQVLNPLRDGTGDTMDSRLSHYIRDLQSGG